MRQEKVAKRRWHLLSGAEKFFTVVIMLSLVIGFSLLVIEASGLEILPGIVSSH